MSTPTERNPPGATSPAASTQAPNPGRRTLLLGAGVAVVAAAGGIGLRVWQSKSAPGAAGLRSLQSLTLPDLSGEPQAFNQWDGRVRVVNFWATWCQPCREEIPGLLQIEKKYAANGLQMVGIGIDQADKMQEFADQFKMDYPLLVGGADVIEITRQLGNNAGGLPFTVVLGRDDRIATVHLGQMPEADLDTALAPLLAKT